MDFSLLLSSPGIYFFPWSNNTLEAVCSVENEAIEFLVYLAVCLKTPWDWLNPAVAVRVVVMFR